VPQKQSESSKAVPNPKKATARSVIDRSRITTPQMDPSESNKNKSMPQKQSESSKSVPDPKTAAPNDGAGGWWSTAGIATASGLGGIFAQQGV